MADVWYYRENPAAELVGPMNFRHADQACQYLSQDDEKSGIAELVSILGERPGDPAGIPSQIRVERFYVRGKVVATGRYAQFLSTSGTTPTTRAL